MASSTQESHGASAAEEDAADAGKEDAGGPLPNPRRFFSIDASPEYLSKTTLYERKAVTDLWNKLTVVSKQQWRWMNVANKKDKKWAPSKRRLLQVHGPPGSGKSSAVFHWTLKACAGVQGVHSFWIDCSEGEGRCWKVALDVGLGTVQVKQAEVPTTTDDAATAGIVVFDGVAASTRGTWSSRINDLARLGIAVIVVSSEGVVFKEGTSQDIRKLYHFVPSWVASEYKEACADDTFWETVHWEIEGAAPEDVVTRRGQLLDRKFETAGHSARFMFTCREEDVVNTITTHARIVSFESLEGATKSDRSAGAVNTLIARLDREQNGITPQQQAAFPVTDDFTSGAMSLRDLLPIAGEWQNSSSYPRLVSAFATEKVLEGITTDVARLRSFGLSLGIQAIVGYALELQLRKKLREACNPGQPLRLVCDGQTISLNVARVIVCNQDQLEDLLRNRQEADTWIFVGGLQGAFDAVHILSNGPPDGRIRFVQVTAGASHPFKLHLIKSLLVRLGTTGNVVTWSHLEFMILRPEDDVRDFTLNVPTGNLPDHSNFEGVPWHNARDIRDNVKEAKLCWD